MTAAEHERFPRGRRACARSRAGAARLAAQGVLALCTALASCATLPEPPATTFRIEVHPLETRTIATSDILRGASEGKPVTIAAALRLPFAPPGRLPAVVFLHGDAGAVAGQPLWIEALLAQGVAVLSVDSFSGRGAIAPDAELTSLRTPVGPFSRVVDAERALALLASHPRIDPARIALMGESSGGYTTLLASQSRFAHAYGQAGLRYAAYIALYPPCNVELAGDTELEPGPVRVFAGLADVVTSAEACRGYVDRLRAAGRDAAFVGYANAPHGFDGPDAWPRQQIEGLPTFARCRVRETADHALVNADTGRAPTPADACVGHGIVGGPDPQARVAVRRAVDELLRAVLVAPR
ncbi:MAG TPA: dienelactone hydrolase family protein [Caldimonas sp.]|nr:dienelactone hydrolase family protein [Caldimonas sp.]